jgi:hypothetical protein
VAVDTLAAVDTSVAAAWDEQKAQFNRIGQSRPGPAAAAAFPTFERSNLTDGLARAAYRQSKDPRSLS